MPDPLFEYAEVAGWQLPGIDDPVPHEIAFLFLLIFTFVIAIFCVSALPPSALVDDIKMALDLPRFDRSD